MRRSLASHLTPRREPLRHLEYLHCVRMYRIASPGNLLHTANKLEIPNLYQGPTVSRAVSPRSEPAEPCDHQTIRF